MPSFVARPIASNQGDNLDANVERLQVGAVIASAGCAIFRLDSARAAQPFVLKSSALEDSGQLARKSAGNIATNANCIGENISSPDRRIASSVTAPTVAVYSQKTVKETFPDA